MKRLTIEKHDRENFGDKLGVYLIYWVDSGSGDSVWESRDDFTREAGMCQSVGYLLSRDCKNTVISQSYSWNQVANVFVIPTVSIIKMTKIL